MKNLLALIGPTAVGKSAIGMLVAKKTGGEIVSADSVQVYRYLDIGTAKPDIIDRNTVIHHLLDIVDPDENYTVAEYQSDARLVIEEIHQRGRLPVLVGGSGLYVRAVLENFAFSPTGSNDMIRLRLKEEADRLGVQYLHDKLKQYDPVSANKIHQNDLRRIIRALEVYEQSKLPISRQEEKTKDSLSYNSIKVGLTMPREKLYQRIEQRVDRMIENGLVDEVKELLSRGFSPGSKAMTSLGYRHIQSFLNAEMTLDEAVLLLKRDTRRYAKRQMTWFRRDKDVIWFDLETEQPTEIAENICKLAGY